MGEGGRWARRTWLGASLVVFLVAAVAIAAWAVGRFPRGEDGAATETRDLEAAFERLRAAIRDGDDEEFFRMHSSRAREEALADFPLVRARYLGAPEEERRAFRERFHVQEKEFLEGAPRDLVVRILPWRTGWRERADLYAASRVKEVRLEEVALPAGGSERRGVVILDLPEELKAAAEAVVEDRFLPTVVFVRDPEGWRRRSFFP